MGKQGSAAVTLLIAVVGLLAGCSRFAGRVEGIAHGSLSSEVKGAERATLENGLKVLIVRDTIAPVATSVLTYKVGSSRAPEGTRGIAHALQLLSYQGGPGLTADQYSSVAMALGGKLAAQTTETQTRYVATVPKGDLEVALHLQANGMKGIPENSAQWPAIQGTLTAEIEADNSSPQYAVYSRLRADLLTGSSYAHDALGNAKAVGSITLGDLKRFHDAWYVPNNAVLVIAGDIHPRRVLAEVKGLFGSIPKGRPPQPAVTKPGPVTPESLTLSSRLAYGAAAVALRFPGTESPDFPAALVLSRIIKDGPGGLGSIVSSGHAFGADFSYDAFPGVGIATAVGTYSQGQHKSAVKDQLKMALAKYMNGGITAATVASAKLRTVMSLEKKLDGVQGTAVAWANALAAGRRSPLALVAAVRKVTPKEVNRVAVRYIDLGKADFATLTPLQSGPTIPLSGRGFGGLEPIDLTGATPTPLPSWARSAATGLPAATPSNPTDVRFANGLRLIVQPERGSSVIDLYGLVDTNPYAEVPKGEEGVNEVLGQLMTGGTSSMNKARFQAALDRIGATESAGTSFSLGVLRNHLRRGVELLSQNLLHPRLTRKDFEIEKKLVEQIASARSQNPSARARHAFLAAVLPATDPALRRTTESEVKALTFPELESYYRSVFRPDMTTIVVVGDISPSSARKIVRHFFGGWKKRGKAPNILLPPGRSNKPSYTHVKDPQSSIDQVRLAGLIPMVRSNPDYFDLEAANEILAGGTYAGRFLTDLDNQNLPVAFLSATYIAGRSRTFYLIDFAAEPNDVPRISRIVRGDISALETHPAPHAEFDRARGALLRSLVLSRTSYSAIGTTLLHDARLHLPLDEDALAGKAYARMTPKQVSAALGKWVRAKDLSEVVQGP